MITFPSNPTTGQVFNPGPGLPTWMWDGSKWTNATTPPLKLASLSDVSASGATSGQALTYDGTEWVNSNTLAGPVTVSSAASGSTLAVAGATLLGSGGVTTTGRLTVRADTTTPGSANGVEIYAGTGSSSEWAFRISSTTAASLFTVDGRGWVYMFQPPPTTTPVNVTLGGAGNRALFEFTSSRRYKTNIRSVSRERARTVLRKLRAVTFTSLCEVDDPKQECFGMIAEEVAAIDPSLATVDKDGNPRAVAYDRVLAMLLPLMQEILGMDEPEGEVYG